MPLTPDAEAAHADYMERFNDWMAGYQVPGFPAEDEDDEPTEPDVEAGDVTTSDGLIWWQYGRPALTTTAENRDWQLARWEERQGYYPDYWTISDHGNAHRLRIDRSAACQHEAAGVIDAYLSEGWAVIEFACRYREEGCAATATYAVDGESDLGEPLSDHNWISPETE